MIVRNRDSWRIELHIADYGKQTLVSVGTGVDLWPAKYVETIEPRNLDRALMFLLDVDRSVYDDFLLIMMGADG